MLKDINVVNHKISAGDKVYLKGKYGMFYEVIVKKIDGKYAFIKGDKFITGNQKVKLEKLYKEPSEKFKKERVEIEKNIEDSEKLLFRIKNK